MSKGCRQWDACFKALCGGETRDQLFFDTLFTGLSAYPHGSLS